MKSNEKDCVFCRIIKRELPAEIILEDEKIIAILDIQPIHFGHALIIPKNHCRDFLGLPAGEMTDVFLASQRIAQALVHSLGLEGFNLFSNNGTIAGQSVFHFHMHVTPRFPNDNIRLVHEPKSYAEGELAAIASKIRSHLPEHSAATEKQ